MSIRIPLTQGQYAVIDAVDFALVSEYRWHAVRAKHTYYARTSTRDADGKPYLLPMHRLVTGAPPGMVPNHEDGNGLNNTRENLVLMTTGDNNRHRVRARDTPASTVPYEREGWRAMRARYGNRIPLGSYKYLGMFALVDEEDYERVAQYNWSVVPDNDRFYAIRRERDAAGKWVKISMHRFVMDAQSTELVDHIHGDGLDNRKGELRKCSNADNAKNQRRRSSNTSGYKGVSFRKGMDKWQASICVDMKQMHLGFHDTAVEAAHAYDAKARELHGPFARTNFPETSRDGRKP